MKIYSIFLVAVLVSISAIAVAQPQTFPDGSEEFVSPNNRSGKNSFPIGDLELFGRLGNFIDPDSPGVSVVYIIGYYRDNSHSRAVEAVFKSRSPVDLHDNVFSEVMYQKRSNVISSSHVSGPTIFVLATTGASYSYKALINKHPDTVILMSSGNDSKKNPEHAKKSYANVNGKNVFHVGGLYRNGRSLNSYSSGPGDYEDSFISEPYLTYINGGKKAFYGTSGSSPTAAGKLAMVYKALNVNHTWSMVDAMQLLMAIRNSHTYHADLTKLLVKEEGYSNVYIDENGKTHLLPEETLREMLKNGPLYKAQ